MCQQVRKDNEKKWIASHKPTKKKKGTNRLSKSRKASEREKFNAKARRADAFHEINNK